MPLLSFYHEQTPNGIRELHVQIWEGCEQWSDNLAQDKQDIQCSCVIPRSPIAPQAPPRAIDEAKAKAKCVAAEAD